MYPGGQKLRLLAQAIASLAVCTLAPSSVSAQQFTISAPADGTWGRLVLAVVDHGRAYPSGGYWCPDDEDADTVCLGADLVEGPADIVAYLSPRPAGWRDPGPRPRVRFIGGHAVRWVDAGRRLAILEQTSGSYLWRVWSVPVERGWACIDPLIVQRFSLTTQLRFRRRGPSEHCFRLSQLR